MAKMFRLTEVFHIVAVMVLVVLVFLTRPAKGADFTVVNRVPPAFTVENRVQPAAATEARGGGVLPTVTKPAPPPVLLGWNVTFSDGSVRFVPAAPQIMPAPETPRPFVPAPATMPGITVPFAGWPSTSWSGSTPTARTLTAAPAVIPGGIDGCSSFG